MSHRRTAIASLAVLALGAGGLATAPAAVAAPTFSNVVLTIGANETQRNVTWIGAANTSDYVQIAPKTGNATWKKAWTVQPSAQGAADYREGKEYNQATLTGLKTNQRYVYRICVAANSCSQDYEFATGSNGNFNFLVYGDPQVYTGTKKGHTPSEGWMTMMSTSTAMFPKSAFVMTEGDQVDAYDASKQPAEWDAFLAPKQLTQYALAPAVGNHDNASGTSNQYGQNLATPNKSNYGVTVFNSGDYYFTYGDALFMVLNSNNHVIAEHEAFLKEALAANPNTKWQIVSFHHAPYSAADHPLDEDVVMFREQLTPIISQLGIDLVLNGHDHDYARSYLMNGTQVVANSGGAKVSAKEGEVLYIATNSSSDGKYYDLTMDGNNYYWIAVANQEGTQNFTNVEAKGNALIVTTYRLDGSVVDTVTLTKAHGK